MFRQDGRIREGFTAFFVRWRKKRKKKRWGSVGLRFPTLACLGLGLALTSAFAFLTLKISSKSSKILLSCRDILEIHRMGGNEFDPLA